MKEIELTQGEVAQVSDEDYEWLSQWNWFIRHHPNLKYAARYEKIVKEDGTYKRKKIYMHRQIAERMGLDLNHHIDHIDNNGLNNQRVNLRSATNKQNQENSRMRKDNTSGYRGVTFSKEDEKWVAQIGHDGKVIKLGRFADIESAISARKKAEEKYFTFVSA